MLWTNGGPGASSLWGLFTEIGPLILSEESLKTEAYKQSSIPTLFDSDTSWTKLANLLILSGPPPVSFGYCENGGPEGDGYSCGPWNDESTAEANFHFLEGWFKKFPAFEERKSEFFITGESYAGIYIPTLTDEIMAHKDSVAYKLLKGVAIGDGCIGKDLICSAITKNMIVVEQKFSAQFLFGHGQLPTAQYLNYKNTCDREFLLYEEALLRSMNLNNEKQSFRKERELLELELESLSKPSQTCNDMYLNLRNTVGYFNVYNLYDECWDAPDLPGMLKTTKYQAYPCGGDLALSTYLAREEVLKALHVPSNAFFFSGDNGVGFTYTATVGNLMPWHKSTALDSKLRVLIYNGDTDHDLNAFFSEWWVESLGLTTLENWRPWTLDGKKEVVGYTMRYEGNYAYATIRGSGHMVPTMKPKAAFELIKQWLAEKPLKSYSP